MSDGLGLAALAALITAVAVIIWRGTAHKPDSGTNREGIGGGPGDGGGGD
ncbi:hypothetical protein [Roseobacter sp. A03A-229]